MRKIIADPAFDRRLIVVEPDTICDLVILRLDGRSFSFTPDVARRIGRALLQVAALVDYPELDYTEGDEAG